MVDYNNKHTVLVCDDDQDVLLTIWKGLENEGFNVHPFSDPTLALEHLQKGCKDCELLVTDIRMPLMNGFQLVRRIQEINPKIMILMMTAFEVNQSEFDTVFPSMHLDGVLSKPFLPSKLVQAINAIYEKKKSV